MDSLRGPAGPTGPTGEPGRRGAGLGSSALTHDLVINRANAAIKLRDDTGGNPGLYFWDTTDGGGVLFEQDGAIILARVDATGAISTTRLTIDKTTGTVAIPAGSTVVGLDLATSDSYADFRVLRNSRSSLDKILYLGYSASAVGTSVQIFNDSTLRANFNSAGVTLAQLAGTGARVVEADASGVLSATKGLAVALTGQATMAADSTKSIDNCFSSAYDNYRIYIDISSRSATAAENYLIRFRVAGADNSSANYQWEVVSGTAGTAIAGSASAQTAGGIGATVLNGTSINFSVDVFAPAIARPTKWSSVSSNHNIGRVDVSGGSHNVSTAYDGITLFPSSGNMTGTIRVYGWRNS